MELYNHIQEAAEYIRLYTDWRPRWGIVLGTGLGNLTDDMLISTELEYKDIPHFPVSTVQSHKGKLVFGYLEGQPVVVMAGRFHYYEGYTMQQVTFPIRVLKALGVETLIVTNAAGSVNADMNAGDIVIVRDHINLLPDNPLRGDNDERLGVRFPDMLNTYDKSLIDKALYFAREQGIAAQTGVYASLPGPNLETPSEYRFIHRIGGDLVGMSSVPEILVARHASMRVLMLSMVSNKCFPIEDIRETTLEGVIAVVTAAEPKMRFIIKKIVSNAPYE